MDVWGTIVLAVNILLLFAGWLLFQQAKSDLTARAAQVPVLSEVKALQKGVVQLLEQLKLEAIQTSAQLDTRCAEARDLLAALDRKLEETPRATARSSRKREPITTNGRTEKIEQTEPVEREGAVASARSADPRRQQVYHLSDQGISATEIARNTGFSEGEVELILSLRPQVS